MHRDWVREAETAFENVCECAVKGNEVGKVSLPASVLQFSACELFDKVVKYYASIDDHSGNHKTSDIDCKFRHIGDNTVNFHQAISKEHMIVNTLITGFSRDVPQLHYFLGASYRANFYYSCLKDYRMAIEVCDEANVLSKQPRLPRDGFQRWNISYIDNK